MEIREVENNDWSSIQELLSEDFPEEKVDSFKELHKSGHKMLVGLIDFNVAGFSIRGKDKSLKVFVSKDCQRLGISKKLR